jgi:hypothetical protein
MHHFQTRLAIDPFFCEQADSPHLTARPGRAVLNKTNAMLIFFNIRAVVPASRRTLSREEGMELDNFRCVALIAACGVACGPLSARST